jgi:hypothetical protein
MKMSIMEWHCAIIPTFRIDSRIRNRSNIDVPWLEAFAAIVELKIVKIPIADIPHTAVAQRRYPKQSSFQNS